ncbi:glutathione synthetase [Microbulbifer aestuariivivens]|uniref:Glutathione synthetase n=1 Tax=Microbulbifer aestuariivivens TaxID=1908308 RepID=A0ABP9WM79_9GAMM
MSHTLGVVMDPIANINFKKDTTLALLLAAQHSGFTLYYFEQSDLYLDGGKAMGSGRPLQVFNDPEHWYALGARAPMPLGELDSIIMRVDPPFDNEYVYSTYILEAAEVEGALVVNKPQSLRDCNEKIFATRFPQCCPPLIVSRDMARLRAFHASHQDVIFKPLDGMGGSGIFHCKPDGANLGAILEMLTEHGRKQIMGQRYIPEIKQGDKRILVVDGEAVPYCLARIPEAGETRGNLAAGGRGEARPLTDRDRWIVEQVAPTLKEKGLLFVGLDVIGDYLTEINVTSPTCAREIDAAFNTDIGALLMSAITQRLAQKG